MDKIDTRHITPDFLLDYFPSPDRYQELFSNPPKSTLEVSMERYVKFKNNINQERARSGKPPLCDADIASVVKHAQGYLRTTKSLKRNDIY